MVGQQLPTVGYRPTAPTPGDATKFEQRYYILFPPLPIVKKN